MHTAACQSTGKSYPRKPGDMYVPPRRLPSGDRIQQIEALKAIGVRFFNAALIGSADHDAPFRTFLSTKVDDERKPIVIAGTAHGYVEDGSLIVILNPEKELAELVVGSYGAHPDIFREIVQKRCDAAVALWVDAYRPNGVTEVASYVSRTPAPARFKL